MDGDVAPLAEICASAERYDALVMVDDSHATGFFGPTGRGTPEHCGVAGRVDIITSTLGKALGGASGGFTAARREIVDLLRQRSRPYLFSNTLPPALVVRLARLPRAALAHEPRIGTGSPPTPAGSGAPWPRPAFRSGRASIRSSPSCSATRALAHQMAADLLAAGIYVVGFSYPVVPKGQARIRVQISAAHEPDHLERAVAAFVTVARAHGVIAG